MSKHATFEGRNLAALRGGRVVFEGVNFTLRPGGALILKGPNGAGKSTLLRLAATLLEPAMGALYWDGARVADDPEAFHERLAFTGHLDAVKPAFTVFENVAFWARLSGGGAAAIGRALDAFDLSLLADLPARFLSAGQKRRTALAALLARPAALWLLDEPTVSLDAASVEALARAIAAHRASGGMVMAATHLEMGLEESATLTLNHIIPEAE